MKSIESDSVTLGLYTRKSIIRIGNIEEKQIWEQDTFIFQHKIYLDIQCPKDT